MYAERFADGPRFRPASLGAALVINGGVIAALMLASPDLVPRVIRDPLVVIDIDPPKPPPPEPAPPPRAARPEPQPQPIPTVPVALPTPRIEPLTPSATTRTGDPAGNPAGTGVGPIGRPVEPPIPPAFVAAREDPRYLADFQPPYPEFERDAGREDIVRLRIRIGIDGRVRQAERLSGRDSFARVAIAHALARWRFKPATRGGVPEESWKLMIVRFTLDE